MTFIFIYIHIRGVFRNNVDFFNNFTVLCSMVIKIILICFCIFLPSFRRVWFSSDDFGQSYRLSRRVTNPGHVKGVHDLNEVAIFWLMDSTFREVHYLSKVFPPKSNGLLVPMYSSFVHISILSLIILCNNVISLSSSRGSLIMSTFPL